MWCGVSVIWVRCVWCGMSEMSVVCGVIWVYCVVWDVCDMGDAEMSVVCGVGCV